MRLSMILTLMSGSAIAADLNIYTYDSFNSEWGPGPAIEAAFEAQCGCDIAFTTAGDGAAMLTRLRIEGDKTEADIALGLDQNLVPEAEKSGLFIAHDLGAQEIAQSGVTWEQPQFYAYDWGYFAFVVNYGFWLNGEMVNDPPKSLEALANSDFSVILENPRSSTPGLGLAMWVYDVYGDDAEDFWKRMKDNVVTVTAGWSDAYSLFLEGEAQMVLSYSTSPAYHRIAEGDNQYVVYPNAEGNGMQIELAAILKSSPNKALAQDFLKFLQSNSAQEALVNGNWMYPVADIALPEGFDAPSDFQTVQGAVTQARIDAAILAFEKGLQ